MRNVRALHTMRLTLADRIKSCFTRDKYAYFFRHFTDAEKELRRMDAWELAKVIYEANVLKNNPEKGIVAEHMLNVRLAKVQTRATYISIVAGLIGIAGGAYLTSAFQSPDRQFKCICEAKPSPADQRGSDQLIPPVPPVSKPLNQR